LCDYFPVVLTEQYSVPWVNKFGFVIIYSSVWIFYLMYVVIVDSEHQGNRYLLFPHCKPDPYHKTCHKEDTMKC
jgi:hypothetical protein